MVMKTTGRRQEDNGSKKVYKTKVFSRENAKQNLFVGIVAVIAVLILLVIALALSDYSLETKWLNVTSNEPQTIELTPEQVKGVIELLEHSFTEEEKNEVLAASRVINGIAKEIVDVAIEYSEKEFTFKEMDHFYLSSTDRIQTQILTMVKQEALK